MIVGEREMPMTQCTRTRFAYKVFNFSTSDSQLHFLRPDSRSHDYSLCCRRCLRERARMHRG